MNKWGDKLSPRARRRVESIEITPEDRMRLHAGKALKQLLAQYYQEDITADELCERLQAEGKMGEFLVREAQVRLIDSLSLGTGGRDFKERGHCLLVLEKAKQTGGVRSQLKEGINQLGQLIKQHVSELEQVRSQLLQRVRSDPRMRMKRAKTPQGEVVVQLSEEEALMNLPEWHQFSGEHERRYAAEFARVTDHLKSLVREGRQG